MHLGTNKKVKQELIMHDYDEPSRIITLVVIFFGWKLVLLAINAVLQFGKFLRHLHKAIELNKQFKSNPVLIKCLSDLEKIQNMIDDDII